MIKKTMVELGRKAGEEIYFDYEKETGFGLAGGSGTGKTNLAINILTQLLDKKEELEITILRSKRSFLYKELGNYFDKVVVNEDKMHKVRNEIKRLVVDIERRKKLSIAELDKEVEKFVLLDDFSIMLINARKKYKVKWLEDFIGNVVKLVNEGPAVGVKSMCVFLRNLDYDAPEEVVRGLSMLGTTRTVEDDYARWDLFIEGEKELKKNGDLYVRTREFAGYVKTYEMMKYVEERRGIFEEWSPYMEMNKRIFDILTKDVIGG